MKSHNKLSFLILSFMLAHWCACDNSDDQSAADLVMPVVVERVKLGTIADYLTSTGTLQALKEEPVITEVEGILHLAKANGTDFRPGAKVPANHLLARIENSSYELEIRVESQKMAMQNAQRELAKQEGLFEEGGVTEKELEIARKTALDARLNFEAAELKAEKLSLKTPIAGYLTNLRSNIDGVRAKAGFELCRVMDYSTVLLELNLPNSDLGAVQAGQKVLVQNYALPDQEFEGRIITVDSAIDPKTRTFSITVAVPNERLILRPGMFVKANIVIAEHKDVVLIQKDALQTRDGLPTLFVVKGSEEGISAELREITVGIETKDEIEITSGLTEGERLVVKGQETLRDKSKVRVTE